MQLLIFLKVGAKKQDEKASKPEADEQKSGADLEHIKKNYSEALLKIVANHEQKEKDQEVIFPL